MYRLKRSINIDPTVGSPVKFFSGVSRGCLTWSSLDSILLSDDVRSGNSTDPTRVPAQKVHKYRSDRRIALKVFSEVSRGCLTWSSLDSILLSDDVRSGNSTDPTRLPAQKVHKYRSDRWIALKSFSGVSKGCFTWSIAESVLHSVEVRSGNSIDPTRVPAQKVHKYRSDRCIALKCFS